MFSRLLRGLPSPSGEESRGRGSLSSSMSSRWSSAPATAEPFSPTKLRVRRALPTVIPKLIRHSSFGMCSASMLGGCPALLSSFKAGTPLRATANSKGSAELPLFYPYIRPNANFLPRRLRCGTPWQIARHVPTPLLCADLSPLGADFFLTLFQDALDSGLPFVLMR